MDYNLMKKNVFKNIIPTNDLNIRSALKRDLIHYHTQDKKVRIIEELGIQHGTARIDIAVINGIMHGYEIKSDKDTLQRLPEQIDVFNSVFDKMTLVVGKNHLYQAINMVPEWWGIIVAKINDNDSVIFNTIRKEEFNMNQNSISVARLLWRDEALKILERNKEADGFYSKPRDLIYKKLADLLDKKTLSGEVRETIFLRTDWRPDSLLILNGG
ncbi:MAG: sce7726 family protein [Candidatus Paceibacterota bacterium]|jgi:hypothetical protein